MASRQTLLHTIKVNRMLRKLNESKSKNKEQKPITNGKY
jgi:hypothetical protein|tara:strand:+ start:1670 stop:1786 length:117 start_codon:yes stop_codon:yes gene_type:complete